MKFVKLSHGVLRKLQSQGYNLLIAPSDTQDTENITWRAISVNNVNEWLGSGVTAIPFKEPHILPIQEALDNIENDALFGSVFIENIMKTLEDYRNEVGDYGERLYLRNDAIRSGDFSKYETFLRIAYPDTVAEDLQEASDVAGRVKQMSKEGLRDWIIRNRVNLIITDLYFLDEGSIISGEVAIQENLQFIIGDGVEDLIDCPVTPHDVLNLTDHEVYWVDPVVKA
ncbi:MAG: hypothetical protein K0S24_2969 [Sphingobacterium sp.]|jgi:hypothetical protein|nr:hypothetical protein [Sphingobacterium sp.]